MIGVPWSWTRCWSLSWSRLWCRVLVLCDVSNFLGRNPQLSGVVSSDQKLLLPCDGVVLDICIAHARLAGELAFVSPAAFPLTQNTGKNAHEAVQRHAPKFSPRIRASNVGLLDGGSMREPLLRSERLPQNTCIQTTIQPRKNYNAKMHVDGNSHGPNRINTSTVFHITFSLPQTSCVC